MKIGKIGERVIAALLVLLVVLIIVSQFTPRHAVVSRSIAIAALPAVVFPLVGDLRRFSEWSPRLARDPAVKIVFTGPTDGVGQTMSWSSDRPDVGSGTMTIRRIEPDREVAVETGADHEGTVVATFTLAPSGTGTTVTWSVDTDLGLDPVSRYLGLMIDGRTGPGYEEGLARLKAVAEAEPAAK